MAEASHKSRRAGRVRMLGLERRERDDLAQGVTCLWAAGRESGE